MLNFQFYQGAKVLCGEGAIQQLSEIADLFHGHKALIVTDPGMMKTGTIDKVARALESGGKEYVIFDGNEPNPRIAACEEGYEVYQSTGCDMVIGVGGGSNLDCAKGINILRYNPGPLVQYADAAKPLDPGHELIMVPTTSGTGSEVSDGTILSDENHIKHTFLAPSTFAEYVVLDYDLLVGMPPFLTASTGLDALAHACEGMTGNQSSPFLELFGQQIIRDIIQYLPKAVADGKDIEARKKMAVASDVAGFMLIYGHAIAGHSIAQTLGAYFDIPHGAACGYTLPWILEYNAPSTPRLTRLAGEAMGLVFPEGATPEQVGTQIRAFLVDFVHERCRMPKLKDAYAYDESKFEEIAEISANELMQNFNPQKLTKEDCLTIIRRMYA